MDPLKSSFLHLPGHRLADPAGEAREAGGTGQLNRRGFLNRGLKGLAGVALASSGLLSVPALAQNYVPQDYYKSWRDSLPREPVDEDDPNTFVMARLKYATRSAVFAHWDARPDGDENLACFLRQATNVKVSYKPWNERVVSIDDPAQMYKRPFIFMTGEGNFIFTPEETLSLREYFERGGFLYADDCVDSGVGDHLYQAMLREIRKVLPGHEMVPVPLEHEIYHCFFDFPRGVPFCQGQRHPGMGLFYKDRLVCYLTSGDLHCAWVGFWKDSQPAMTQSCFRMGVNIIMYALTH